MTTKPADEDGPFLPPEPLAGALAQALAFIAARTPIVVEHEQAGPLGTVGWFDVVDPDSDTGRVVLKLAPGAQLIRIDPETLSKLEQLGEYLPDTAAKDASQLIGYLLDMVGVLAGMAGVLRTGYPVPMMEEPEDDDEPYGVPASRDPDAADYWGAYARAGRPVPLAPLAEGGPADAR